MDLKFLAGLSGVNMQSVVEHKRVGRSDILRIDLKNEPALRRTFEARADGKAELPDGDIFTSSLIVDGQTRDFPVSHMDKERSYNFGENGVTLPAWILGAETYPPNSQYGALVERINFTVFDRHSGQTHDLSIPNENWRRPWMAYGLGLLDTVGELFFLYTEPSSGFLEINHRDIGENHMHLAASFAGLRFDMPNLHGYFEQAPDRPFVIDMLPSFYDLDGTW